MPLYGIECRILTLDALIASKRAAVRPKDLLVLPELEALREVAEKSACADAVQKSCLNFSSAPART